MMKYEINNVFQMTVTNYMESESDNDIMTSSIDKYNYWMMDMCKVWNRIHLQRPHNKHFKYTIKKLDCMSYSESRVADTTVAIDRRL